MNKQIKQHHVVVAISGASGSPLGQCVVRKLSEQVSVCVHAVVSPAAELTFHHEIGPDGLAETLAMADHVYEPADIGARIASGSFRTAGMIVVPCSIRSLSAIANSFNDTLISRAADVHLKERRRLILAVRETPFHLGHLDLMKAVTMAGAIVFPPVPAFYAARTLNEVINQSASRMIDLLDLPIEELATPWEGLSPLNP